MGRPGRALNTMCVHWAAGVLDPYLGCREGGTQQALVQRTLAAVIAHLVMGSHVGGLEPPLPNERRREHDGVVETWKCWPPVTDRSNRPEMAA